MNLLQSAHKVKLQAKIDRAKLTTAADRRFETIKGILILCAVGAFPLMTVWYPSAWFLAGLSLTMFSFFLFVGLIACGVAIKEVAEMPSEIQRMHRELRDLTKPKAGFIRTLPIFAFVVGLGYINFPLWAVFIGMLAVGLHVMSYHYRKMCDSFV